MNRSDLACPAPLRESECDRHGLPWTPDNRPHFWHVKRCAHLDLRFVVEIGANDGHVSFVDYVEDGADGHLVDVEAHHGYTSAQIEATWEGLTERMRRGDPLREYDRAPSYWPSEESLREGQTSA